MTYTDLQQLLIISTAFIFAVVILTISLILTKRETTDKTRWGYDATNNRWYKVNEDQQNYVDNFND